MPDEESTQRSFAAPEYLLTDFAGPASTGGQNAGFCLRMRRISKIAAEYSPEFANCSPRFAHFASPACFPPKVACSGTLF
jgi:hypothetical protein